MRRILMLVSSSALLACSSTSLSPPGTGASSQTAVGQRVGDFQLTDQNGKAQDLYYFADAPAVTILATVTDDPASDAAATALEELQARYRDDGVAFLMLNSALADDRREVAAHAAELGLTIPVLKDDYQLVGESLGVQRAGEAFVIDPSEGWEVVYQGPVDAPLEAALDAVVADAPVEVASLEAAGAPIAFPSRREDHSEISYVDDIAPILLESCVTCHQPGSIGPWHMTRYEAVRGYSPMMREVIRSRRMPPYHADPEVGRDLKNHRFMDPEDVTTLIHWIEAGAPRGEGEDPLLAAVSEAPEWPLGEPDLVLEIPAYDVPATGVVDYQYPSVEWPLDEGRWLKATTIKAGSRETVHHVLSGHMESMPEPGVETTSMWRVDMGGYAVGAESMVAPEDWGAYVPAGGAVGFQMHYTPIGREVTDVTKVGYYFYDEGEEPTYVLRDSVVLDATIVIPPNTARHEEVAYLEFPADALLYGAFPHAHYRGQSSTLTLIRPDGTEELLLSLPKYDFNWQRLYEFAEPVEIEAGSKLVARYEYDNSARNRANPDPDAQITWGLQSFDEMLYTAVRYRWADETADNLVQHDETMQRTRMVGMLDDDIDGLVQQAELRGGRGMDAIKQSFAEFDQNADGGLDAAELAAAQQHLREQQRRQQAASASGADAADE